ncbi:MAG: hypothetical protein V4476_24210 [Pseudomonadota bacterium]
MSESIDTETLDGATAKKERSFPLVAALGGAILALVGQYFITYLCIENPKIKLERDKVDIETYKLGLTLIPEIEASCFSKRIEKVVWRMTCQFTNKGQYPVVGRLLEAGLYSGDDVVGFPIMAGKNLYIQISNWKEMFTKDGNTFDIPTGTIGREFGFIVKPSDDRSSGMVARQDIVVKTIFDFQTMPAPVHYLRTKFPDADEMLTSFSKSARPITVPAKVTP